MDNDRDISRDRQGERYRARLTRALVPFALVARGWLGLGAKARRAARRRNVAVAAKLALLADAGRVAALRARLGGLAGLLAWERRASRAAAGATRTMRLAETHRARMAARCPEAAARVDAAMADIEAMLAEAMAIGAAWDAEDADEADKANDPHARPGGNRDTDRDGDAATSVGSGGARPPRLRFALPALPSGRVPKEYVPPRNRTRKTSSPRRAPRAHVVHVWPSELMSAEENARLAVRRARRVKIVRDGDCEGQTGPSGEDGFSEDGTPPPTGLAVTGAGRVRDGP